MPCFPGQPHASSLKPACPEALQLVPESRLAGTFAVPALLSLPRTRQEPVWADGHWAQPVSAPSGQTSVFQLNVSSDVGDEYTEVYNVSILKDLTGCLTIPRSNFITKDTSCFLIIEKS